MALSKIQAESMNLADTYAFSGTVSGTPNSFVKLASTTVSSNTTSVNFDSSVITSTYPNYLVTHRGVQFVADNGVFKVKYSGDNGSNFLPMQGGIAYQSLITSQMGSFATTDSQNFQVLSEAEDTLADNSGYNWIIGTSYSDRKKYANHTCIQQHSNPSYIIQYWGGCRINSNTAINYIQYTCGQQISSGTFTLYGVAE